MGRLDKITNWFGLDEVKAKPLVNEPYNVDSIYGQEQTSNSPLDYNVLWEYATKSPEVLIPVHTIISDVIADGFYIRPYNKDSSGRNRVKQAREWLSKNRFSTAIQQPLLWDALITGDDYLYIANVSDAKINEKIGEIVDTLGFNNKKRAANLIYRDFALDYSFGTMDLVPLASETVKISHDKHQRVIEYIQTVGTKKEKFSPDEVIHNKYIHMNGKVYGFTPMKSIISELQIIANAKDILGYGLEKGGIPEFMYIMEDESPKSPNVKNLSHQLRRFKNLMNKGRSLLLTGKVDVKTLTPNMKDMMFKDLIDTFGKIVLMVWGVPPSKMGMVGDKGSGYDSGLATEGYYKKIATLQDWFYAPLNWELFIPKFGVELVPKKSYLQDEVRESQVLMQKVDTALKMYANGWVTKEYITEKLLSIDPEYVGDFEVKDLFMGEQRQNLAKNDETNMDIGQQEMADAKRKKQNKNMGEEDDDD